MASGRLATRTDFRSPARFARTARIVGMVWAVVLVTLGGAAQPGGTTSQSATASIPAENVAVITIRGPIDRVTAQSVARRIRMAEAGGAGALVFDLDTPGGEVGAVLDICTAIKQSRINNTVAWINPNAYSGGAIIALACREIIAADAASIGDALPVAAGPLGIQPMPEPERQKVLAPLLSEVVDSARRHGYDEKLVQGMVSQGVELWLVRRKADGMLLFIGPDEFRRMFGAEPDRTRQPDVPSGAPLRDAPTTTLPSESSPSPSQPTDGTRFIPAAPGLEAISGQVSLGLDTKSTRPIITEADRGQWELVKYVSDGRGLIVLKTSQMIEYRLARAIVNDDEQLIAYFGARNLRRLDANWSEAMVAFMTNWLVRAVLIAVFLIGLFLELAHPGLVVPGGVAAVALVALLAPPMLVGMAGWWEVAAIAVGILLVVIEIFVLPGFGIAGILGIILIFGGLLGTFVDNSAGGLFPDSPKGRQDLMYGAVSLLLSIVSSGIAIYFISKHFGSLPLLSHLVLRDPQPDELRDSDPLLAAMASGPGDRIKVGTVGRAITPLRPAGKMEVGDQVIDVVSDIGFIAAGTPVRVLSKDPFRTVVEPVPEAPLNPGQQESSA